MRVHLRRIPPVAREVSVDRRRDAHRAETLFDPDTSPWVAPLLGPEDVVLQYDRHARRRVRVPTVQGERMRMNEL